MTEKLNSTEGLKIHLSQIKQFFEENGHYPECSNGAELIQDGKRFVESHIAYLESNSRNQRYKPYYDRLLNYYNYAKQLDKGNR